MKIITFSGRAGAGKNYIADRICEELNRRGYSTFQLAFADKMKDMLCETLDISREQLEELKRNETKVFNLTIRKILQNFGQMMKKHYSDDIWIKFLLEDLYNNKGCDFILITDLRCEIEDEKLSEICNEDEIYKMLIQSPADVSFKDNHTTETEHENFDYDLKFLNDKKNKNISKVISTIVDDILEKFEIETIEDYDEEIKNKTYPTFETFKRELIHIEKLGNTIRELDEGILKLFKSDTHFMSELFADNIQDLINKLKEEFGDDMNDSTIEWFIYETDMGRDGDMKFDIDGVDYSPTFENIYKLLTNEI